MPLDRTSTSFPLELQELLRNFKASLSDGDGLKYYQRLVPFLFEQGINSRGILLRWEMGVGKTLGALAIGHVMQKLGKKVIVMTRRTQRQNIIDSIQKYNELTKTNELNAEKFKFITLSPTIKKQIVQTIFEGVDPKLVKDLNDINKKFSKATLNGYTVIVDEAHELFRMIANGSDAAVAFYYLVMRSPHAKMIFLTGTPIPGDPFVIAPCFNMLAEAPAIFPENRWDFEKYFVDRSKRTIKNKEKFQNRIMGLVSNVGYFPEILKEFPEDLGTKVIEVPMDGYQYGLYQMAREKERAESKNFGVRQNTSAFARNQLIGSSYRVKSRMIGNYVKPAAYIEKPVESVPCSEMTSPKFAEILKLLDEYEGIAILYSQFTGEGGLRSFRKFLDCNGWFNWNSAYDRNKYKDSKTYAFFDGTIPEEEIDSVIKMVVDSENKDAKRLKLIMFGITGVTGLDTKYARLTIQMEPAWTPEIPEQFRRRAIRYRSHEDMPKDKRNVQSVILVATHNPNASALQKSKPTTDEDIYQMSENLRQIINSFIQAMAEVSIECQFLQQNCRTCAPTNVPLFSADPNRDVTAALIKDMADPDPCQTVEQSDIEARQITVEIEGEKHEYFYRPVEGDIWKYEIYAQDEALGAYRKLSPKDPIFQVILSKIKK